MDGEVEDLGAAGGTPATGTESMMKTRKTLACALLAGMVLCGIVQPSYAGEPHLAHAVDLSRENCLKTIQVTAAKLGVNWVNTVNSTKLYIAEISTSDGKVVIACANGKMAVVQEPND